MGILNVKPFVTIYWLEKMSKLHGIAYEIKEGDSLWTIAEEQLGDPREWPRIFAFNNMPAIKALGNRVIEDPDLIYAGETLQLPILSGMPGARGKGSNRDFKSGATRSPHVAPKSLKDALQTTRMPYAVACKIEKNLPIHNPNPNVRVKIKLSCNLTVKLARQVLVSHVVDSGMQVTLNNEAEVIKDKLISHNEYNYDLGRKRISFSNCMIANATNIAAPKTALGFEFKSSSGMPVLKAEIIYPKLEGKIDNAHYVATDAKIVIEIEGNPNTKSPEPARVAVPQRAFRSSHQSAHSFFRISDADVGLIKSSAFVAISLFCAVGGGALLAATFPLQAAFAMTVLLVAGVATSAAYLAPSGNKAI